MNNEYECLLAHALDKAFDDLPRSQLHAAFEDGFSAGWTGVVPIYVKLLGRTLHELEKHDVKTAGKLFREFHAAHSVGGPPTSKPGKRIYISGPMTGLPGLNFPAFNAEAARLRAMGYEVVNPAELNPDPTTPYEQCMRVDIAALLTCDAICLLPDWHKSKGAETEVAVANALKLPHFRAGCTPVFAE